MYGSTIAKIMPLHPDEAFPARPPGLTPYPERTKGSLSEGQILDVWPNWLNFPKPIGAQKISTAIKPALVHTEASRFIRMVFEKSAFRGSFQTLAAHIKK